MEIGLYPTPGVDNIRSTSFYGLTFVRVTFKYGIDYFFAYTQANLSLQQNVSLPGGQIPQIQQSSLVGEVYRYQVVGPPNFGLTNLRTVQDWIAIRRLFTVPGVVQVNSWGGTTKQFDVEVDLHKLDAYNVTIPQVISNLGTANINVGGREITVGQQSVNIRGIGLFDDGGDTDLTQGWKVTDIENVVLTSVNGVPVQVKDVAKVSVGYVPRLGIAGKDRDDDVALSIVVMGRTFHTNDVVPRIQAEIERINSDGTLPPGVKLVPYYDRASLVAVTTHTVLHNLVFGCLFLYPVGLPGRLAQRHHCRREYSVRAVFQRHHPGTARTGCKPALRRCRGLRHHRGFSSDPGRKYIPQFPGQTGRTTAGHRTACRGSVRDRSDQVGGYGDQRYMDRSAAVDPGERIASR
jgi:cobalt-zinc-cadmium resistance protein CzcA